MTENIVPLLAGFVVPIVMQWAAGWWLDSGRGVAMTMLGLCVLSAAAAAGRPDRAWRRASRLTAGSIAGSAAGLIWNGAGTIWPVVLIVAGAISAAATFAGAAAGRLFTRG